MGALPFPEGIQSWIRFVSCACGLLEQEVGLFHVSSCKYTNAIILNWIYELGFSLYECRRLVWLNFTSYIKKIKHFCFLYHKTTMFCRGFEILIIWPLWLWNLPVLYAVTGDFWELTASLTLKMEEVFTPKYLWLYIRLRCHNFGTAICTPLVDDKQWLLTVQLR